MCGVGCPVNDCMSCWRTVGWCWGRDGGDGGLGDMISQGGLQEVRVGLTCIRIKQCWEVEFFFRGLLVVVWGFGTTYCKQKLTWGYLGRRGCLCSSNYTNNR